MPTREATRPSNEHVFDGMGRTAVVALSALGGSVLLIAVLSALVLCWRVHPLLTVVAGAALVWLGLWMARLLLTTKRS